MIIVADYVNAIITTLHLPGAYELLQSLSPTTYVLNNC